MPCFYNTSEPAAKALPAAITLPPERAEAKACAGLYTTLIEQLPALSDRSLADDLERTSMLVDPKSPDQDNLVWKYYVSVKRELEKRAENRLRRAVERAEKR